MKSWSRPLWVILPLTGALAFLAWHSRCDPAWSFLPRFAGAEWIVFPRPVHGASHAVVSLGTTFRRDFTVETVSGETTLQWCAAKRATVRINDSEVPSASDEHSWKLTEKTDVRAFLKPGRNVIEARVFNDNAPPALWLSLEGNGFRVATDQSWQSSNAGSSWQSATLASVPRFPGPGNPIYGAETMASAWRASWPFEACLAGMALLVTAAAWFAGRKIKSELLLVSLTVGITVLIWLALFANNASLLPVLLGFDAADHVRYVQYIQEHHSLPWPTDGYEMFQPPLFYAMAAMVLGAFHGSPAGTDGILLLRFLNLLAAIGQIFLVLACVRLLFGRRIGPQVVGLIVAAALPMQLYLSHYVTNETLAALLGSLAFYLALRLLHEPAPSWSMHLWLGLTIGAGLLAKNTVLLLVPPIYGALILKAWQERGPSTRGRVLPMAASALIALLVSGWYYFRIWHRFGTPLLGNWDPASGFSWWQDPGFHMARDYFRFGRVFTDPFFSGLNGFVDGIYATLWGDSLGGGAADLHGRPPWNYNWMVAGYVWSILPSALIVCGSGILTWRFLRDLAPWRFLILGVVASVLLSILYMTLKVACFGQVKAFYGLTAIVPICLLAATGWECVTRFRLVFLGAPLLVLFALNSFASVRIRADAERSVFLAWSYEGKGEVDRALSQANQALQIDGSNADAHIVRSVLLDQREELAEALAEAQNAVKLAPASDEPHTRLANVLLRQGDLNGALTEARAGCRAGPENFFAREFLLRCLTRAGNIAEIAPAARDALTVTPFSPVVHNTLGLAAARANDFFEALTQFAYAVMLETSPSDARDRFHLVLSVLNQDESASRHLDDLTEVAWDSPVVLSDIAWVRATARDQRIRNAHEAVRLSGRLSSLTNDPTPWQLLVMGTSYAAAEYWDEAAQCAQQAIDRARAAGEDGVAQRATALLGSVNARQSFQAETAQLIDWPEK